MILSSCYFLNLFCIFIQWCFEFAASSVSPLSQWRMKWGRSSISVRHRRLYRLHLHINWKRVERGRRIRSVYAELIIHHYSCWNTTSCKCAPIRRQNQSATKYKSLNEGVIKKNILKRGTRVWDWVKVKTVMLWWWWFPLYLFMLVCFLSFFLKVKELYCYAFFHLLFLSWEFSLHILPIHLFIFMYIFMRSIYLS